MLSLNLYCEGNELRAGSSHQVKVFITQHPPEGGQVAPCLSESWEAIGVLLVAEKGVEHVGGAAMK